MPSLSASPALRRFRVLDLSRVRAGPTCVRMLADFGADVIRIEPPPGVDPNEAMFAADRWSGDFQNLNRNKRSLTLNLKKPEGLEVFRRLVAGADVVVENWRPDVKARLGVDYASLRALNPRIILASISGFGQTGPYAGRPGFDQIVQGMGGLMSVTGLPGQGPVRAGLAVADSSTGLYTAIGILTALLEREVSGEGQWVHASLLHAQIAMMDFQGARYLNDGDVPVQEGNDHPTSSPMGLFQAQDGAFNLGASGEGNWKRFCQALGRQDWLADPEFQTEKLRVRHRQRLNTEIQAVFERESVAYWVDVLNAAGVPAGPVYNVPQMFEDAQVRHLDVARPCQAWQGGERTFITQPVTLERTPADIERTAPGWGSTRMKSCAKPATKSRIFADCMTRALSEMERTMNEYPPGRIVADRQGGVLRVRICNPARFNAMSLSMWQALHTAVREAQADETLRAIVLHGEGDRAFVSGADISEFGQQRNDPAQVARYDQAVSAAQNALADSRIPTIAVIQGICMGGGMALALACDLRYCNASARFRMAAARLGLGYALDGVKRMRDMLGAARTMDLFLTARTFDGGEAARIGLVHEMFADSAFAGETQSRIEAVAGNAPLTMYAARLALRHLLNAEPAASEVEQAVQQCFGSADYREGQAAFRERRPPVFKGR
ncbi:enoyl-CoA hydratase/isomerase family protein [Bordetella holmesii 44057]|nr:enoyl-CoA hydratase/isomerase family protein [Bordetella holmesii 44057]EWM49560.1 enoyl-CoA hydratase/isomerase family protein [Bordetella holmesii 35009]